MREAFAVFCLVAAVSLIVTVATAETFKPKVTFYNQAHKLKTECELPLERTRECKLVYLPND